MIVRTSVLFPAPLGPRRPSTSPSRTSSETPSSALRPLKDLATLETTNGAATAASIRSGRLPVAGVVAGGPPPPALGRAGGAAPPPPPRPRRPPRVPRAP